MDRMNPIARDSRGRSLHRHPTVHLLRIHFQKYRRAPPGRALTLLSQFKATQLIQYKEQWNSKPS